MPRISSPLHYIRALIVREDPIADVDEEIQFHIDSRAALLVADGMPPDEARRVARKRFGDVNRIREECRMINFKRRRARDRGEWFAALWLDIRLAVRMLAKRPGFTAVAVATLALGMGATTAVFSLANWLMIRPVPGVHDADQLGSVRFDITFPQGYTSVGLSSLNYADVVDAVPAFTGFVGYATFPAHVAKEGATPGQREIQAVTGNYFDVLGVVPQLGRTLTSTDNVGDGEIPVVISDRLWNGLFDRDARVLGRSLQLNGVAATVVGVAPVGFRGPKHLGETDVWYPEAYFPTVFHGPSTDQRRDRRRWWLIQFFGRLSPTGTFQQAGAQIEAVMHRLGERYPEANAAFEGVDVQVYAGLGIPGRLRDKMQSTMRSLLLVVGLVLFIACANVANLMLLRGVARRGEHAVRKALGASGLRLIRMHLVENLLLSLLGGAVAITLAVGIVQVFAGAVFRGLGTLGAIELDWRVLTFATAVAIVTGFLFSLAPAVAAARTNVTAWLNESAQAATAQRTFLRGALTVAQLGACVTLLVGSLLLIETLRNVYRTDVGFDPARVTAFSVDPGRQGYSSDQVRSYYQRLLQGINEMPGVSAVSVSQYAPFGGIGGMWKIYETGDDATNTTQVSTNGVTHGYFEALGTPITKGRAFTAHEVFGDPQQIGRPAILNETLAAQLFSDRDPIGRTFMAKRYGRDPADEELTVIGVVKDHFGDPRLQEGHEPFMFRPLGQAPFGMARTTILVRSVEARTDLRHTVEEIAASIDNTLPLHSVATLRERLGEWYSQQTLFLKVLGLFTVVAVCVAAVGLYGVVAYGAAQRKREMGIRLALGAEPSHVLALVIRQGIVLAVIGILLGVFGAVGLARVIESQLHGVSPLEPTAYVLSAFGLALVAVAASVVPARAATRVDPVIALRYE